MHDLNLAHPHATFLILFAVLGFEIAGAQSPQPKVSAETDSSTPTWASTEKATFIPQIHHSNVARVTCFAENPDIVTPVGIAVAPDGRVFVQENHTHKRTSDYQGPPVDRILIFEDTDHDGVADERSVFYQGDVFSTDLLFGPDGHLYVSTRWFVGRFLNAASRTQAQGEPQKLVICETDGDYPHNGVGGLAIDPANPDWLAFGFGENLGFDYTFVGSDGTRISGGGEGGSTYRCRTDGTKLTRQTTGHWNAFGMTFDLDGNLFSTDNDPNATPPNRLLHLIPGADFGYEYRYGRSGRHPLVSWYGETPGTLGMIGALGEAACGVIPFGPNQLLSASWADNRIDVHTLKPKGKSLSATRAQVLSGPDDFRPVHFSYAPDGKYLYFTDWASSSYPVHGKGRIWRIEFKQPVPLDPRPRHPSTPPAPETALQSLGSPDPYVRTEAIDVLTRHPDVLEKHHWHSHPQPIARAHHAVALKRVDPIRHAKIIPELLNDPDADVRYVGIKWIADYKIAPYRTQLEQVLNRSDLDRRDLRATLAALAWISTDSKQEFATDDKLITLASDPSKPASLRALALQNIKVDHKRLTVDLLATLARDEDATIVREAIRSLAIHPDPSSGSVLADRAADRSLDPKIRADAIAGLAAVASNHEPLLESLTNESNETVATEAKRTLYAGGLIDRSVEPKPPLDDAKAWQTLMAGAVGTPDPAVGRRLFFHSMLGGCYKCHARNGRGNSVGPDLTTIHRQSDITPHWLIEQIVNPNAEIAPYYRPQQLITVDGKVLTGLIVGREGQAQGYIGIDGKVFFVDKNDIVQRRELPTSIMPTGLLDKMTVKEIRDLIAYLLQEDEP